MIYIQLFLSFIQIGALSFGGGYAAMPLIQNQVVDIHHWLTVSEFNDLVTISQMTPGPIAVNSATFVGEKLGGIPGAVVATLGCIFPSLIIVTIIAYFYTKYRHLESLQSVLNILRPAVVAMIASSGFSILLTVFFGEQIEKILDKIKVPVRPNRHYQRWGRVMISPPSYRFRLDGRNNPKVRRYKSVLMTISP